MKKVICGFPGVGKSTITKEAEKLGLKHCFVRYDHHDMEYQLTVPSGPGIPVFDSDSSLFDKSNFPKNYVDHIENVLKQEWMEDVIILVSSHDNVRKMLHERGIEYCLAYPQIELKADYIERYKERGSSDQFVGMMEDSWVKFITDCEEDPTKFKSILSEGEYLVDYVKLLLDAKPDGVESLPPTEVTATIIDANAGEPLVVVEPDAEAPPPNDPTVLNVPEQSEAATLTAEGNQSDYDNDSPKDPESDHADHTVDGNESEYRSTLIEYKLEMQNDLDVLEPVILDCQDEEIRSGLEGYEDHGPVFTKAAEHLNARYGANVEPTLAGIEGFFADLKNAFKETFDELKGKPTKAQRVKIQKSFYQARQAIDEYSSSKWLGQQKFINVGKVKLQVPAVFKEINTASGMAPIVDQFTKAVQKLESEHARNVKARLSSGVKMYNKLRNSKATDSKEIDQLLNDLGNVTPDALPDIKVSDVKSLIDLSLSSVELPVLKKDDVSGMVKLLKDTLDSFSKLSDLNEGIALDTIDPSEFSESDFWDKAMTRPGARKVYSAVATEDVVNNLAMIEEGYGQQLIVIGKFIEMWILSSVK